VAVQPDMEGCKVKNDLAGKRFGRLLVTEPTQERKHGAIVWRCRCDCGRDITVDSRRLKCGTLQSCGCDKTNVPAADLTGRRFGKLVVLEKTTGRSANRSVIWRCRCDCGNEVETTRGKLLSGNTSSCGCGRIPPIKDWVGKRFGHLMVIAYNGKDKGCHLWRCRCDCGNEVSVRQSNLQSGYSESCGCSHYPPDRLHFVDGTCIESIRSRKVSAANSSGVRGVYFNRKRQKWIAQIMFKGKCYYLGGFDKIEDAAKARERGEEMFDDFLDWYNAEYGEKKENGEEVD